MRTARALVLAILFSALASSALASAQDVPSLALMPMPAHMVPGDGMYLIDGNFSVKLDGYTDHRLLLARQRFLATLFRETGIPFVTEPPAGEASLTIDTAADDGPVQKLGEDESYRLTVAADGAKLMARTPLGAIHGLQTFLQLVRITPQGFGVPVITIDDQPRFPWRGLMIDTSRHFMPVPVIERNLDGMEAVKLNVFHWHLSDDQGFRLESKLFPRLQEKASGGHFYTQDQVREVIAYARDRGIRVVPEFDMPCHVSALLTAYPDLGSGPGPYTIGTHWGIFDAALNPTRESTYRFINRFLDEVTALFPDAYFHMGGDECNGKEWNANPHIQQFMRAHGLKDNAALQAYFTARVQKLVVAHHKIPEGWDEVLQPNTPQNVLIQSWRGPAGVAAAARHGNPVILSNGYYVDLNQSAARHYAADPLGGAGASLDAEQRKLVLGGEAAMWSEFVTQENIDSRIWPRTAAIAERLWSPQSVQDVNSMYKRLAVVSQRLQLYGLEHLSSTPLMLQRMSGETDPQALAVLASVVQPPEGYAREGLKHYDTSSPLNRMVDAIPPESNTAREFAQTVRLIVSGTASPEQWSRARSQLILWRDNDARLEPHLGQSQLTEELIPVSQTLARVATVGLQALDNLQGHRTFDNTDLQKAQQELKDAEKPQAVLRMMIVPPVQDLVRAASAQ